MSFQYYQQQRIFIWIISLFCTLLVFYEQYFLFASAASVVKHKNQYSLHANPHLLSKKNHLSYVVLNNKNKRNLSTIKAGADTNTPWSNAFNFKKIWGTEIDPRTGILSAHVKTGSLLSNWGHGPNIDLEINYSSNAYADVDKLGYGWNWNLTHFNPVTHQLTTSSGQNFYLQQKNNRQWFPLYHKLKDIRIVTNKNHLIITYANGLKETLNDAGYETLLEQQDGWSVHFCYQPGTHLLQSVTDDEHHSISLKYTINHIKITSKGSEGQPVSVVINKEEGQVRTIALPVHSNDDGYSIYFSYTGHLITRVSYPTGLKKTFTYNCNDEMKVDLPLDASTASLCVVIRETVDPGAEQPLMTTHYQYTQANNNEHNYLGFNSGLEEHIRTFKDRLFESPVDYTYRTLEDNGLTKEIHTYNKYHLLIDDQQISDRTQHILSEAQSFFCRTDQPNGCAHSSFADLPDTYSQPLKVVTKLWGDKGTSGLPAITFEISQYDEQGRIISHTDTYGRLTKINYCPLSGDRFCPPAPKDWPFNNLEESTTLYPAQTDSETVVLAPVITQNYYRKQPNHQGNDYILVLDHQIKYADHHYRITNRHYYQDKNNVFTYGLLKQTIFTGDTQPSAKLSSVVHDYYYTESIDNHSKTTWSAVELSAGKKRLSTYITTSLFTNHILQSVDASGKNIIRYHYDLWDRLIQTDTAVGTPFAASSYYQYTVSPVLNQVLVTAVNGMQSKVMFDGAGRQLINFSEAVSSTGKAIPGQWVLKHRTTYDRYGRQATQSAYLFDTANKLYALTTMQKYDDSGRVTQIHLPDQETAVTLYDDAERCVISYHKSSSGKRSALSVVKSNVLYKPLRQWVLPANNGPLPSLKSICTGEYLQTGLPEVRQSQMTYDGFGRLITETDPLGHVIKKHYDAPGRLTDITNPAGDKIHYVYDLTGHTIQRWSQPVSGGNYLLSSAEYNAAGDLLWSAGEDGRRTVFTYSEDGKPISSTSPAGHTHTTEYNNLGLPITTLLDGKIQSKISYDPVTILVTSKTDMTGTTTFTYDDDELIQQQSHSGKQNYPDYQLHWYYDHNRHNVSVTDIANNKTKVVYDRLVRVKKVIYQQADYKNTETLSTQTYDDFSRVIAIQYGSGMHRSFHYDSLGHTDTVTDRLNNALLSRWSFRYDLLDNITLKTYQTSTQQASSSYWYDTLDNLIRMTCTGTSANALCPRDTVFEDSGLKNTPVITRQNYSFTPLNQLNSVQEQLQNPRQKQTLSKTINYHYTDKSAPFRLQTISTTWNQHTSVIHHFNYDIMSNMITEGEGNHITYNAFNQILQVIKPDGKQSAYAYDSSGKEVMEKNSAGTNYLFYRSNQLINEKIISPQQDTHITGYQGSAKTIDGFIYEYNESNYKGDVVATLTRTQKNSVEYRLSQRNVYSPYGMRWHNNSTMKPLYQQTFPGFDGERTDHATGWQFLGAGHRTYNPKQRYFVSEDPAGGGYGFGGNNPIMNSDPTGNMPNWLGTTFKWLGYASSFGLSALHAKWAHIAGTVITTGLTIATLGAAAYTYGGTLIASAVTAGTAIAGSVPVAAAAIPANKGLNIAASVIGGIEMAAMVTTAAVYMGLSFMSKIIANSMLNTLEFEMSDYDVDFFEPAPRGYKPYIPNIGSILKNNVPEIMNNEDGGMCFFRIRDYEMLKNVWSALKSANNHLISYDVGCVLAIAQIRGRPVNILNLELLFEAKMFIYLALSQNSDGDVLTHLTLNYLCNLFDVFISVGNFRDFIKYSNPLSSLEQVMLSPGEECVVAIINHMHPQLIIRETDTIWSTYDFKGNEVNKITGQLDEIENILLDHANGVPYGKRIMHSMKI